MHHPGALEQVRATCGLDPHDVRRLRNAVYKNGTPPETAVARLPAAGRARLEGRIALAGLTLIARHDSAADGATKLIFRTATGLDFETVVLRPRSGRGAVCVSSQVGCAAACRFCATGHMGMARNLQVAEILEQVAVATHALHREGRRLRNVVFMGMGEPLHNRGAVEDAVARLLDPSWFGLSPNHVTVSTIGVVEELLPFVCRHPTVRLALSLHAARPDVRARLMPLAAGTPLAALRRGLEEAQAIRRRPLMIQYLLLHGINDGEPDLDALLAYCRGLDVRVNLIPFNPIAAAPELRPSPPTRQARFTERLRAAGLVVTTRASLGRDIDAACGQLVRRRA